jgi:hypothetical protein
MHEREKKAHRKRWRARLPKWTWGALETVLDWMP